MLASERFQQHQYSIEEPLSLQQTHTVPPLYNNGFVFDGIEGPVDRGLRKEQAPKVL